MTKVALIRNAGAASGVGHHALALLKELRQLPAAQDYEFIDYFIDGDSGQLWANGELIDEVPAWTRPKLPKTINWLRLGSRLRRHFKKHPPDIIHATNQTLSWLVHEHERSIVTVHDLIEVLEPQSRAGSLTSHLLYRGIPRAKQIIAISTFTASTIQERYTLPVDRIHVIPNGVDPLFSFEPNFTQTIAAQTLRAELRLQPGDQVVLYVGSDHPRKNVATALRAFATLKKTIPDVVFVKVGEPGLRAGRADLLNVTDELQLNDSIRWVGNVSREKLSDLYRLASVFIYPSRFEGFGLPPLEAMASGVPVVSSNATSLPEVVGEAGILVAPDDVAGFATAVAQVLEDKVLAEKLRQAGLQQAARFSWARAAQQLFAVYEQV